MQLSIPVKAIDLSGRAYVEIRTARGTITTRAVIVTASTGVLLDNRIRFEPELPRRYTDALQRLTLGSYDHIALELPGNPLGLARDEVVFEKSSSARTGAILANVAGTTLCLVEVGGKFGREVSGQGEQAMVEFALDWLAGLYGSEVKRAVKRTHATQWNKEPWALGAFSSAAPGGQPPTGALRTVPRPAVVRGRSDPRDAVGHRGRRVGLRRPCGAAGVAQNRRRRRAAARAAGYRRRPTAAVGTFPTTTCHCPGLTGQSSNPRVIDGADALPHRRSDGYWIARSSRAMSINVLLAQGRATPRSTPPVRLPTSATIFAATASISWSVMVLSRGCKVTAIAIDFLLASITGPS